MKKYFILWRIKLDNIETSDLISNMGGVYKRGYKSFPLLHVAELTDAMVEALRRNRDIESIEVVGQVKVQEVSLQNFNSQSYDASWGITKIGCPEVHARGITGQGVKVVILDTGSMLTHEDLVVKEHRNFVGGSSGADDHGHGTHVHGIIAAQLNGKGVAGVAPDCDIYVAKVINGSGFGTWDDIIEGLNYAIELTQEGTVPVVSNHSYGSFTDPGVGVKSAYDQARAMGVHLIAASGNSGAPDDVHWPARWDSLVAVGSTDSSDGRSGFSSRGPELEVAGPGGAINSTTFDGGYGQKSGTSMATPHIVGAFALAISAGLSDPRGRLSISTNRETPLWEPDLGWGRIDVVKMVGDSTPSFSRKVRFDGSFSTDGDGVIVKYRWDIEGTGNFVEKPSIFEHTYDNDGTFNVTLEVTDDGGLTDSKTKTITVAGEVPNKLPIAEFTVTDLG